MEWVASYLLTVLNGGFIFEVQLFLYQIGTSSEAFHGSTNKIYLLNIVLFDVFKLLESGSIQTVIA